ncbi:hypothetical protein HPB50_014784 [Hyalomma asiaticum]|uniref:Uncharacterized protein n=1 Tax=Hyalomma asiaticum TaxID=266040 RepID=A0ACB7TK80_HYAAI|nr:hypothetical protein HPB50_014784 [Hyalomma asiaticum]
MTPVFTPGLTQGHYGVGKRRPYQFRQAELVMAEDTECSTTAVIASGGPSTPLVLFVTHFSELLHYAPSFCKWSTCSLPAKNDLEFKKGPIAEVDSHSQPVKGAAETPCSTAHGNEFFWHSLLGISLVSFVDVIPEESPVGGDESESVKESSCSLALPEGTPVDSHKQPVKGAAEIPCPTVNESSPTSSDESDGEKESACSSAPPTSAGTSSTFAAKSRRPKYIIKRLQGRVCKYKKTIERLRKRQERAWIGSAVNTDLIACCQQKTAPCEEAVSEFVF